MINAASRRGLSSLILVIASSGAVGAGIPRTLPTSLAAVSSPVRYAMSDVEHTHQNSDVHNGGILGSHGDHHDNVDSVGPSSGAHAFSGSGRFLV